MSFYNTNQLKGNALREAVRNARNQQEAILTYYLHRREAFSPSEIMQKMQAVGKLWPITSIRRAITDLTNAGHLVKTEELVKGMYDMQEHKWIINPRNYPIQEHGTQQNLFEAA